MRKILTVLVDRANFGRMWPVMRAVDAHPELTLQVMCSGTMVLERFGHTWKLVEQMGFTIDSKVYMELEGGTPLTMAKSVGFGIVEYAGELNRLQPDIVLIIGDRHEALAVAVAAAYSNIPVAHVQGGEVSGSIDESARHAITKFSHLHFPATARAASFIERMGESRETIKQVGCPCGDFIRELDHTLPPGIFSGGDPNVAIDPSQPYFLVIFHPVTTEFGTENDQVQELLNALEALQQPVVWLWPNIDAGSDHISKVLRKYRSQKKPDWLKILVNFSPDDFQRVLSNAACAIGNSSSFVRDSTFTGVPVVLVGDRQQGRECGINAVTAEPQAESIRTAVERQLAHGRYEPDGLYGEGMASQQIAEHLARQPLVTQKRLAFSEVQS